jgi:hypothetical protein
MTTKVAITSAELKRMADVANSKRVTVWKEVNGQKYGVSPDTQTNQKIEPIDMRPENFTSLDDWKNWKAGNSARQA